MEFTMIETGWLSILPPIIAIALALITKEVYSSLFIGIISGMLIYAFAGDGNVFSAAAMTFDMMSSKIADNAYMIIFLALLWAVVSLVSKSGGSQAYGRWAGAKLKTKRSAAFAALGYKPEQVNKILLTHRHADHSGELKSFPNAKIYVNTDEVSADELKGLNNIVPVRFTDGAYYNFPDSQKIMDGIYMIKAKGHTNGNSIIIAELDGLFYMIHGDITYVDEALYEDKLSVVYDDLGEARKTQDLIREFIRNHPTVYMGTHTPQGYENLEAKRVMDLDAPVPTIFAEVDFSEKQTSGKYVCSICGYVYDPAEHDGVAFEDLPDDWKCERCKQGIDNFNPA